MRNPIRSVIRDNKILFGPIRENMLDRLAREPIFANHGIAVLADDQDVQIFATVPNTAKNHDAIRGWQLNNSYLFV